jgi:hypothetical protein
MRPVYLRAVVIVFFAVLFAAAPVQGVDFSGHWHDGKAEMDGYRLKVNRYGEERTGQCVMIYVTEPFSESKRVKADYPDRSPEDSFDALKLNLVRDFQTGIYDYNTMVSVFVRSSDFSPVKLTFTSAEWCGHVYDELLFYPKKITGRFFSYFEGESGETNLKNHDGGLVEDNLFIVLRGLRGHYLEPGASKRVRFLPGVYYGRLAHKPLEWEDAKVSRLEGTKTIDVPAGSFESIVYTIETGGGRTGTFYIESEYPHRIIRWEMLPDIEGELTGSKRLAYWKLNKNGDEQQLRDIGLEPPVPTGK